MSLTKQRLEEIKATLETNDPAILELISHAEATLSRTDSLLAGILCAVMAVAWSVQKENDWPKK